MFRTEVEFVGAWLNLRAFKRIYRRTQKNAGVQPNLQALAYFFVISRLEQHELLNNDKSDFLKRLNFLNLTLLVTVLQQKEIPTCKIHKVCDLL